MGMVTFLKCVYVLNVLLLLCFQRKERATSLKAQAPTPTFLLFSFAVWAISFCDTVFITFKHAVNAHTNTVNFSFHPPPLLPTDNENVTYTYFYVCGLLVFPNISFLYQEKLFYPNTKGINLNLMRLAIIHTYTTLHNVPIIPAFAIQNPVVSIQF